MKRRFFAFLTGTLALTLAAPSVSAQGSPFDTRAMIVANAGSSNCSVIDTAIDEVVRTVGIPSVIEISDPVEVIAWQKQGLFSVVDASQDSLWIINRNSYGILGAFPLGEGSTHGFTDPNGKAMMVVNQISRTMTALRPRTLSFFGEVPMPNDLALGGGFPHDVTVDNNGNFLFVAIHGMPSGNDAIVKYDRTTLLEVDRHRLGNGVGDNPHVAFSRSKLFVPCEGSDIVHILDAGTLDPITTHAVPNPRGASISADKNRFYTTNATGGGTDAIWAISTQTLDIFAPEDSPSPIPHHCAGDENNGRRLYVSHRGAGDTVSIYNTTQANPDPVFIKEITVGSDPQGLDYAGDDQI